ncbi:hypothetical protein [Methylacidimicrobium tartarophylax]|uniref:Uncharacterized protein n=1 Tax=Methylacidimicrobium tartarophylax TaxID=1041768 RepID=A0A5E6MGV1_9BACT|nr:hypothetical protein [Methylacidimicrobium tartarophylax]VVM07105.1 hypothetical protein MAMT_01568 [Methylacidimicrobium tartarophylax]
MAEAYVVQTANVLARLVECLTTAKAHAEWRGRHGKKPIQNLPGYAVSLWSKTSIDVLQPWDVRQAPDPIAATRPFRPIQVIQPGPIAKARAQLAALGPG